MSAIAAPRPAHLGTSVATGLATAQNGSTVTMTAHMVRTGLEFEPPPGLPANEIRLTDQVYGVYRSPGTVVYADPKSPAIKLNGITDAQAGAMFQAEADGMQWQAMDGYNTAGVTITGTLNKGDGPFGSSIDVTDVKPASWQDINVVSGAGPK